ncbi:uncharacterized protein CC84DRAFT_1173402 [Paraphaeosphaeria sporulosa]|uniref:Uncharacterized protein n=1 Tax=Paraphaeosphaeria sporulosa TaxID=1460663 RepID=A0A177CW74_9PLEO|nr:uncharacterized protein CC84DRAFT_1173402 [Paraphaeosphaeria sporulosa]OAG11120.1 hypothetical protein CC84DRAFT_1173402 [Paraphaeosphaeria sporulosa]
MSCQRPPRPIDWSDRTQPNFARGDDINRERYTNETPGLRTEGLDEGRTNELGSHPNHPTRTGSQWNDVAPSSVSASTPTAVASAQIAVQDKGTVDGGNHTAIIARHLPAADAISVSSPVEASQNAVHSADTRVHECAACVVAPPGPTQAGPCCPAVPLKPRSVQSVNLPRMPAGRGPHVPTNPTSTRTPMYRVPTIQLSRDGRRVLYPTALCDVQEEPTMGLETQDSMFNGGSIGGEMLKRTDESKQLYVSRRESGIYFSHFLRLGDNT